MTWHARKLSDKSIREIHKLANEGGCPCCKQPIRTRILAARYNTTRSTISRIKNGIIVPSGPPLEEEKEDAAMPGSSPGR